MADQKISALTGATTPLAGTEVLPIVQGAATVKVAVSDLTAGRAVSATSIAAGLGLVGTPAYTFTGDLNTGIWSPLADQVAISTGGVERLRVTSIGSVLVGTTSSLFSNTVRLEIKAVANNHGAMTTVETAAYQVYIAHNSATAGDNNFMGFGTEVAYTSRGGITYNRAGGLVSYNTMSDYRAKEVFGPVEDSGVTIDSLKIYTGKMLGATQSRPMLIAHEAQAVAPYAVTGEKDAVNEDGTPHYQQMDTSALVPLLIAEVQSLRARVALLEGN